MSAFDLSVLFFLQLAVILAACESHREAAAIGALMNARGLRELIILNIGLTRGIIEPALFRVMVLMAVVTTLIFQRVYGSPAERGAEEAPSV